MQADLDVTVVVPAYNAETTIAQAIESALDQVGVSAEVIVVDDGSTDATSEVATRIAGRTDGGRIRVMRHPGGANRGVAASRNLALEHARAEAVAFLDADDWLLPGALGRGLEVFRAHPDVVLVYGRVRPVEVVPGAPAFVGSGVPGEPVSMGTWLLFENPLPTSGTMARRRAMLECLFPEGLRHQVEDWAAWLALSRRGKAYFLDIELACYRRSAGSWTGRLADRWVRQAQLCEEAELLRSFARAEPSVSRVDLGDALAYRSGIVLAEALGRAARLRLGAARRCLSSAFTIAGTVPTLVRAAVWWMPQLRLRSWFPPRGHGGPAWKRFTAS